MKRLKLKRTNFLLLFFPPSPCASAQRHAGGTAAALLPLHGACCHCPRPLRADGGRREPLERCRGQCFVVAFGSVAQTFQAVRPPRRCRPLLPSSLPLATAMPPTMAAVEVWGLGFGGEEDERRASAVLRWSKMRMQAPGMPTILVQTICTPMSGFKIRRRLCRCCTRPGGVCVRARQAGGAVLQGRASRGGCARRRRPRGRKIQRPFPFHQVRTGARDVACSPSPRFSLSASGKRGR